MKKNILISIIFMCSMFFIYPVTIAFGYSSNAGISVVRQMPSGGNTDETITIEITLNVGSGIAAINGLYFTDEIPEDLTIETDSYNVMLNGANLTSIIEEIGILGDIYPSAVPYRLILETPPDFTEDNPLYGDDELVLTYDVTIPSDATLGTVYTFPGYSWVGRISSPLEDIFGYEDSPEVTLTVLPRQITITVTTNIGSGTTIRVDGATYEAPYSPVWDEGDTHEISVDSPQSGGAGIRHVFSSWNDGGGQTHSVAPTTDETYIANLHTQFYLTVSTDPAGITTISGSGWYDEDAGAATGVAPDEVEYSGSRYGFDRWAVDGSDVPGNPLTITMNNPKTATAHYLVLPGITKMDIELKIRDLKAGMPGVTADDVKELINNYMNGN